MGCGGSTATPEREASRAIDRHIKDEVHSTNPLIKALLLGTGASGKTTVCKQMRLLFMSGYTDKEAGMFREPIVFNLLRNMAAVAECAAQWGLVFEERLQPHAARLRSLQVTIGAELDKETGAVLAALWRDPAAIGVMARANETAIDDAHSYFMSQVGRIAAPDYVPSTEDILRCRVKTLGIVETRFHYKNSPSDFVLVDVGGQRTERRKWIHVFDDVTIVLYVISLSDYDLLCEEDNATNRLTESWQLFGDVANNKFFARTNMVVFYNKNDLFVQKAGKVPFARYHPDYKGPETADAIRAYIRHRLEALNRSPPHARAIYPHTTCATDTESINFVWKSVADVIMAGSLQKAGFSHGM